VRVPEDSAQPVPADKPDDQDPAFAAMVRSIERLDELDLEAVEPASAFHWD
jgi:hypothetical protein